MDPDGIGIPGSAPIPSFRVTASFTVPSGGDTYSPFAIYGSPYFYGGYYGHPHAFADVHGPYGHGFEPQGGFRGGFGGGFHGGGFRGGGGGRR